MRWIIFLHRKTVTDAESLFNSECICMDCKKKECADSEYKKAQDADIAEIRKGNYNFKGIRG